MRLTAVLTAAAASGMIALLAFMGGFIALGSTAAVGGLLWVIIVLQGRKRSSLGAILAIETGIAVIDLLYGASIYLCGSAVALSIIAWDLALTEGPIAPLPPEMKRRFAVNHVLQIAAIAVVGLALSLIPPQFHIEIGFNIGLGLGLGVLMLLSLLLRMLTGKKSTGGRRDRPQ